MKKHCQIHFKKIAINTAKLKVVEKESFLQEAYYDYGLYQKRQFEAMSDEEVWNFLTNLN